ncbi:MAG: purine-binding chemotaxis protein CheW [Clostridium sp.]|nr:purine-binding chemotaxis protein CheW [Clostridium sp.]
MESIEQYIIFAVGKEEYAISISVVKEVIRLKGVNIAGVPNTRDHILGIINLRGEVIPIIDLRIKFNMTQRELDGDHRIIIVNFRDKVIGLLVDSVAEVSGIEPSDITKTPDEITDSRSRYISGIAKYENRVFIILDIGIIIGGG